MEKIAVITDDGFKVSQHFGKAIYYLVITIDDGKVTHKETRPKQAHDHHAGSDNDHQHSIIHGMDTASHDRHTSMLDNISDCQILVCGGMGHGAYESATRLNIRPIITNLSTADEVVSAYLSNSLVNHTEKLH